MATFFILFSFFILAILPSVKSNIKKIQLQELEFITSFTSKKGVKNRRYKKKYNNKTK